MEGFLLNHKNRQLNYIDPPIWTARGLQVEDEGAYQK